MENYTTFHHLVEILLVKHDVFNFCNKPWRKCKRSVTKGRCKTGHGRTSERGRTIYLEMIHHAQSQPGPVLRQKDFQAKRKQQRLESQLVTYLASQGGTVSPEQVQSEQKTAEIVQLRRDFARQALSQGYSVNEIAVALKVSSRSVRNWCQSDPRHAGEFDATTSL